MSEIDSFKVIPKAADVLIIQKRKGATLREVGSTRSGQVMGICSPPFPPFPLDGLYMLLIQIAFMLITRKCIHTRCGPFK